MKTLFYYTLSFLGMLLIFSCEQNFPNQELNLKNNDVPIITSFTYNGKFYSSLSDSMQNHLAKYPELTLYIDENGDKEYFETHEDFIKHLNKCNIKLLNENTPQTRASGETSAVASIYKDPNYRGDSKSFQISSSGTRWVHISDLASIGFSQNISSTRMTVSNPQSTEYGVLFRLWENPNYTGMSMGLRITNQTQWLYPDLRSLPRGVYGATWNDAARSCKLNFVEDPTTPPGWN
mgnify:CR=1 FL=1